MVNFENMRRRAATRKFVFILGSLSVVSYRKRLDDCDPGAFVKTHVECIEPQGNGAKESCQPPGLFIIHAVLGKPTDVVNDIDNSQLLHVFTLTQHIGHVPECPELYK